MRTSNIRYEPQWELESTDFTPEVAFDIFVNRQTGGKVKMASVYAEVTVEGGRVDTLTVADIWDAFPKLAMSEDDGYTREEVAEGRRRFASDVRIAAKRNRENAAYDRIEGLQ